MRWRPSATSAFLAAGRREAPAGDRLRERRRRWRRRYPWSTPLLKVEALLPECEVPPLEDLRHDVRVAANLKVDDGWGAVRHFVDRGQFLCFGLDVRELPVVPDGFHEERLLVLRRSVSELQSAWILLLIRCDLVVRMPRRGFDRRSCLCQLALKLLNLCGAIELRFRFGRARVGVDVHLEIRRSARLLRKEK